MSEQNGDGRTTMDAEVLAAEFRSLAKLLAARWVDAAGIAEHLDIQPQTVQNRTGPNVQPEDRIPFHRLPGGEKRFYVPEVDEWLLGRPA